MTPPLRATGITPLQHYKETDSPPQLDSDEAAMTYERFIRCGSAKPVANYYEAVRPSPAHRYFRPRGWSRLRLVWGFSCQGVSARRRTSFISSFVRSESRSFVPTRASPMSSRAGAVKVGRRTNLAACSALARPYLDSSEHDGTLGAVGMAIRGELAFGRGSIAPQPCIRRARGPEP